jgi:hypothetical protein
MGKIGHDSVTREMRERLLANRHGKLTSSQWSDMVTEPLVMLLLVLAPGIVVLRYALVEMLIGGFWIIGTAVLLGLGIMLAVRARRYARMAIQFTTLYGGNESRPMWMFWKAWVLYDEAGKPVRFPKSLAPSIRIRAGQAYLVYYLNDGGSLVLLSIAPADHPDADIWKPSGVFNERLARRL